jgi:hypothetical protein
MSDIEVPGALCAPSVINTAACRLAGVVGPVI